MAQVPMRMAQPSLVPPHQQRPPMMVSMTQPPPVSMQGLVSMAPMMGPGGGMAVVTQSLNHPDSGHDHHTMNGPYHHHHHHHPHSHHPPHGGTPRPHAPSQGHHAFPPPPPHPSGPPQPPQSNLHSQYHPHHGTHHHNSHNHHNGPHSGHHSNPHSVSHSHSNHTSHMTSHSSSNSNSSHTTPGHPQPPHLQSETTHMNQAPHSMSHHSPHQISGMSSGRMNSSQHHNQGHHTQHHPQQVPQPLQRPQVPSQAPQPQQLQHQVMNHTVQQHVPQTTDSPPRTGGLIVLNNSSGPTCTSTNLISNANTSTNSTNSVSLVNGVTGRCSGSTITETSESSSASTREKTPMCLINELARYNKIAHQYCLTDEKGPAHKKIFTVTLKLGDDEEYSASGPSIKKAQHSAAALSLEKTKFKHPPPKTLRQNKQAKLTPTVELNALAMKRGEAAIYTFVDHPRPPNPYAYNVPPNLRNVYNQKLYGRPPLFPMFFVTLRVGSNDFCGEGATAQQAKHNAASKALKFLKPLPMPDSAPGGGQGVVGGAAVAPAAAGLAGGLPELDPNADLKSPISLVHEIALKRNVSVAFEVVRESGPPHMRTFVTTCAVGDLRTQGEGTGKKVSKKRAAELMLEELKKLPALAPPALAKVKRKPSTKKKSRNLIKVGHEEQKAAPEYGQGINPISRLIQIQQAKKEKEPVYTLKAERGVPRRREFVMQVTVLNKTAQGSGPNKKLAKRAAAENMLQLMGYSRPQPQPAKPAIKMEGHSDSDKTRKQVTFLEENEAGRASAGDSIQPMQQIQPGSGRQLVPGLIMMPDGSALHDYHQMNQSNVNVVDLNPMVNMTKEAMAATAAIAKELLESGSSPTAKALTKAQTSSTNSSSQSHAPSHQMSAGTQQAMVQKATTNGTASQVNHLNHQNLLQGNPQTSLQGGSSAQQKNAAHIQSGSPSSNMGAANSGGGAQNSIGSGGAGNNVSRKGGLSISGNTCGQAVRPKEQLMYLANILSLQVQFTDFPKGNKSEYLSLVSLSTTPPHVSHGAGPTIDASHDQACLTALRALAEMGLDAVTSGNTSNAS